MTTSEQITDLATALAKAQAKVQGAKKDAENPHFRSKYADLASCWDACREALTVNGLSVVQSPRLINVGEGAWMVEVETMLLHGSGQWIRDAIAVPLSKMDAQGAGSAITYGRRYALAAFVGIAPEDDDANAAVGSHPAPAARPAAPPAAPKGGPVQVVTVTPKPTSKPGIIRHEVKFSDGTKAATISERLAKQATDARDSGDTVRPVFKTTNFGTDLVGFNSTPASDEGPSMLDDEPPF
jgi:hypothetical protein